MWMVITAVIVLCVGGYAFARHTENDKLYNQAMTEGNSQISKQNYTSAETAFNNALRYRPNDISATGHLSQTQSFVSAQDQLNNLQFTKAEDEYQSVVNEKNGSSTLALKAKFQVSLIKSVETNRNKFEKIYQQALTQSGQAQYQMSNMTLQSLLSNADIHQPYYSDILQKVNTLKSQNDKAISGQTTGVANSFDQSNSNSSSSSSSSASSSSGLTSSEKQAAANYPGKNEFSVTKAQTELNGKVITQSQINSARQQIKASGIDANAMSNQDVRNIIKGAAANHQSIGQYAKTHR